MSKSVRLSESFHEFIESHSRDDETIAETLRRLVGGPDPEAVSGIISTETASTMREEIAGGSHHITESEQQTEWRDRVDWKS